MMRNKIEIDRYLTTVCRRVGLENERNVSTNNTIIISTLEISKMSKRLDVEYDQLSNLLTMIYDYYMNYYDSKVEEIKQFFEEKIDKYQKKMCPIC